MKLKKIKDFKHKEIIILSVLFLIVYLLTLSCSFDEEDSIHLTLGIRDFNINDYRPHPPGYPVYIFLGKIFNFFTHDELLAQTILGAICGALSLLVFYFLIFEMFNKKIALMSALIMAVTPLFWIGSLKALTDIPALFFTLLSMYFIYCFIKYKKINNLYIGSLISGISVGVRLQTLFVLFPLLVYACFVLKKKKEIFLTLLYFSIGILIWLIPVFIINGFKAYIRTMYNHTLFVLSFKGPQATGIGGGITFDYLFSRTKLFSKFFLAGGYGFELDKFNIFNISYLLVLLFFLFLSIEKLKNKQILFFVIGISVNIILVFIFLPSENIRYFLILIPFISLLLSLGVSWFEKYSWLAFILIFVLLFVFSFPLAQKIHTTPSPPIQLINYINENYNSKENIFIFSPTIIRRFFMFHEIPSEDFAVIDRAYLDSLLSSDTTVFFVDPSNEVYGNYSQYYNITHIKTFERDLRIHIKHNTVFFFEVKTKEI